MSRHPRLPLAALIFTLAASACTDDVTLDGPVGQNHDPVGTSALTVAQKGPRYAVIRDSARARGIRNAYLLAGIANTETGLAQCWSEAQWACQGPASPECGGGPVIAGSADGPCNIREGGLGMFQFDAGTYQDTINRYGSGIVTVDGQIAAAIDYTVNMVKISAYTTNAETDAKAREWINNFDISNATLRDQWIKTVLRYYNGCQPTWSCWNPRYQTYTDGMWMAVNEAGGMGFWEVASGTRCGSSPMTVGQIDAKYRALGGCGSFLGAPITEERSTPDGVGRYTVFERGSIYWTAQTGAFEVHGTIRDKWRDLGWEGGVLGYPITDEKTTPDGVGRYTVFQGGSVYWKPATGAHEVYGVIRDTYAANGWEAGMLGYPTAGEYDVPDGRRSDFENGTITWNRQTGQAAVDGPGTNDPPAPRWKVLGISYQVQETGYWCGPAATRHALSARMGNPPTQSQLAQQLPTSTNGTDWIGQITTTLNNRLGASRYRTVEMPNDPPTQAQRDRLWNDILVSIDNNYPVVANIVAPPSNHPPGYPSNQTIYHYFTVTGYNPDTRQVYIADSANFGGNKQYWLTFDQLATLIPPKGYSTYVCPTGMTVGDIDAKFRALGGCRSVVGGPTTGELTTPDGVGRYNVFENGSIYWSPSTGAHEVHGRIRDKWRDLGWEGGTLGYPTSDEYAVPGGRRSDFQRGSLVWNAQSGAVTLVQ
jgi:hypothetical protein